MDFKKFMAEKMRETEKMNANVHNSPENSGNFEGTTQKNSTNASDNINNNYQNSNKNEEKAKQNFDNMYKKYSNKSKNDINKDLFKMVAANKANGKLTNKDLDNFYNNMSGLLDSQQRENLKNLIEDLKNDNN